MRKLSSIKKITGIAPILNADRIVTYSVGGWRVVDQKDKYSVGDNIIYFEVDSLLPEIEQFEFLRKNSYVKNSLLGPGFRLRTIKLRGQISQGLIMPIESFPEVANCGLGDCLDEILGVKKWEPVIPASLSGKIKGNYPTNIIPKTDQERVQNIFEDIDRTTDYETTIKLDGASCTMMFLDGELRVCSRNLELKTDDLDNSFVQKAKELEPILRKAENFVFQGELYGPGIQGNKEKVNKLSFAVFDVFRVENGYGEQLLPKERRELCLSIGIEHVPVLEENYLVPETLEEILLYAEGPSLNYDNREGVVFKPNQKGVESFKAISNRFLLKFGE